MLDIELLRRRYLGANVRTERPATPEERERNGSDTWGGEGKVVDITRDAEGIWFKMDWGMAWVVDEATTIITLEGPDV